MTPQKGGSKFEDEDGDDDEEVDRAAEGEKTPLDLLLLSVMSLTWLNLKRLFLI